MKAFKEFLRSKVKNGIRKNKCWVDSVSEPGSYVA